MTEASPVNATPGAAADARSTSLVVDLEPAVRVPWRALVAVVVASSLVVGAASWARHVGRPAADAYAADVCAKASAAIPPAVTAAPRATGVPPAEQARHAAFVAVSFAAAISADLPSSDTSIAELASWRDEVNAAAGQLTEAAAGAPLPELLVRRRALADRVDTPPLPPSVLAAIREDPGCDRLWAVLRAG